MAATELYVVTQVYYHEGETFYGAYTTRELAREAAIAAAFADHAVLSDSTEMVVYPVDLDAPPEARSGYPAGSEVLRADGIWWRY